MSESRPRRVGVAVILVVVITALLWFAAPVSALTIDISPPEDGCIGDAHTFTVQVNIEDTELIPIQSVALYIKNSSNPGTYTAKCLDLPLIDGSRLYTNAETGGGTVDIDADADSGWGYGYGYRHAYGYEATEGWGYQYFGYGYGYGYGPTSITYVGAWTSLTTWPKGNYEIEVRITADSKTFTKTSSQFTLLDCQQYRGGGVHGGGSGGADTTPPEISDVCLCSGVDVTETTAQICWITDERSTTQVEFWSSPHQFSALDKKLVYEHSVLLTGLTPGTVYYYRTLSEDFNDNLAVSDIYTFTTFGAAPSAAFALSSLSISPSEVDIGETVTISLTITNTGELAGTYELVIEIDGEVEDTQQITLDSGESEDVTIIVTKDVSGTYEVTVNGLTDVFVVREVEEEEEEEPILPPVEEINWWIVGGIITAVAVAVFIIVRTYRLRRA